MQYTNITIVGYFTNKNYIGEKYKIQVTNIFKTNNLFTKEELDYIFNEMTEKKYNKFCNKTRGNKSVSGGYSIQIRKKCLTSADINYEGIFNCNTPHFTTTFGKM